MNAPPTPNVSFSLPAAITHLSDLRCKLVAQASFSTAFHSPGTELRRVEAEVVYPPLGRLETIFNELTESTQQARRRVGGYSRFVLVSSPAGCARHAAFPKPR